MPTLIRTEHLTHLYPAQPEPIAALRDVSLEITRGEYVAIVGANGSGKSTLARHLNALLLPTEGQVWIEGANTRDPSQLRGIRQDVAMVFQNPENQFVATVAQEDVAFGPENFGVPPAEIRERVDDSLQAVGLATLRARPPHELSAGQQQRLAIAGALAVQPAALILDEATSMLDPQGKAAVMELAARLHDRGLTLAAITQSMDEAARAARVIIMEKGAVVGMGTPREVLTDPDRLLPLDLDLPPFAAIARGLATRLAGFQSNLLTRDELVEEIVKRRTTKDERRRTTGEVSPGNDKETQKSFVVRDQRESLWDPPSSVSVQAGGAAIITTRALRHTYLRGTPRAFEALRGVDLDIYPGEIVGIVGAAGSGKSTLLQHFNGLIRPRPGEGQVSVDGIDLADPRADVRR
ncbi:MAG: energy-coupling factor transporter ATPase, partial [Rudaea sp.]